MAQTGAVVRVNTAELNRFLKARGAAVDSWLGLAARQVADRAKASAPRGKKPSPEGKSIRDSIIFYPGPSDARGPAWFVGGRLPHLGYVTYGTPPHQIHPRRVKHLRFQWPKISYWPKRPGRGQWFVTPSKRWPKGYVNHPGIVESRRNDFLARAVREVVGNFKSVRF